MVGIARCFYTAGRMNSELYNVEDPAGKERTLDDTRYAIDHFYLKLLKLPEGFQTRTGSQMAQLRHENLTRFLKDFLAEV